MIEYIVIQNLRFYVCFFASSLISVKLYLPWSGFTKLTAHNFNNKSLLRAI